MRESASVARRMRTHLGRAARWPAARGDQRDQRRWGYLITLALTVGLALLVAGCGGGSSYPGGVYQSSQYHFSVRYPSGWQANTAPQPSAAVPLTVIITRSATRATNVSLVSSLTITVLNANAPGMAQSVASLGKNPALKQTTLGGQTAYTDGATQQTGTGPSGSLTVTHTDYYLVAGAYEYTITADALSGDEATIQQMMRSFTLGA